MFLSVSVFLCVDQNFFCHGESFTQRWLDLFSVCAPCFAKVLRVCGCVRVALCVCVCVCVRGPLSVQLSMNKVKTEQDVQLCTCVGKEWNDCFDYLPIARPSFCFSV